MHSFTADPVLTVEDGRAGSFLQSELGLGLMWRVCSKASDFLENGKRLENLSWRLWNHQIQHLDRPQLALNLDIPPHRPRSSFAPRSASDIPPLSNSAESLVSIDSPISESQSRHSHHHGRKLLLDRYVTPDDLDNLVHNIKEAQDLTAPLSTISFLSEPPTVPESSELTTRPTSPRPVSKPESSASTVNTSGAIDSYPSAGSDTSATSVLSSHSVVRGFTPGTGTSSYTSKSQLAPLPAPILRPSGGSRATLQLKKKGGMFLLGGSSGEDESSLRDRMSPRSHQTVALIPSPRCKKQTSFKEEVDEIKAQPSAEEEAPAVFDSDDEDDIEEDEDEDDDELSEDVIDEDDDDAWEDEAEEEHKPKQLDFRRIDSTANLTSRRSQLTLALERSQSQGHLPSTKSTPALRRSRTSTPNGPSMPASPDDNEDGSPLQMRGSSRPKLIQTTTNQAVIAPPNVRPMSPRTTRQQMLAGEMPESFRKQLLWERKQRNVYTTQPGMDPIRRAYTAQDLRNMGRATGHAQDSAATAATRNEGVRGVHWNHYFDHESTAGYHQKGW